MTASEMRLEQHGDCVMLGERLLAFLNDVVIGREPLPRNASGKIQKAELRALAPALPPPASKTR